MQAGCINANDRLVWPNAQQLGEYDIVADFGNNVANAMQFAPDNAYNTPLDVIDGYFSPGFRIVDDPGTLADWANAGSWQYDENTVPMGFMGTVTVQDEQGGYSTPGAFMTVNWNVPLPSGEPALADEVKLAAELYLVREA